MLLSRMENCVTSTWFRNVYSELLRDGRVWDMHDLFMVSLDENDTAFDCRTNLAMSLNEPSQPFSLLHVLERLVQDWQVSEYDESTILGLLSLSTTCLMRIVLYYRNWHLEPDTQVESIFELSLNLSNLVRRNDPDNMRSRPFTRWLLWKAIWEEYKCSNCFNQVRAKITFAKGLSYYPTPYSLPVYAPDQDDNLGWMDHDAPAQFRDIVQLVTNVARTQDDHMMETLYLTQLIHFTSKPAAELARLLDVQHNISRNIIAYHQSLLASYIFCGSDDEVRNLKSRLDTERIAHHIFHDAGTLWLLHWLRYSLWRVGESASDAFGMANHTYQFLPNELQRALKCTSPQNWVQAGSRPNGADILLLDLYKSREPSTILPQRSGTLPIHIRQPRIHHGVDREEGPRIRVVSETEALGPQGGGHILFSQNVQDLDAEHNDATTTAHQRISGENVPATARTNDWTPPQPDSHPLKRRFQRNRETPARPRNVHSHVSGEGSNYEEELQEDDDNPFRQCPRNLNLPPGQAMSGDHEKSQDNRRLTIIPQPDGQKSNQGASWRPTPSNQEQSQPKQSG